MRRLKKVLFTIIILCLLVCVLYFTFHIDTVKVEGTKIYTEEEIKASVFTWKFLDNGLILRLYDKFFNAVKNESNRPLKSLSDSLKGIYYMYMIKL